ncbi:phosphatidylserine decarboxylase [Colletotrichum asianum]|uniref:Phosphatidylserine decarboxylase n=1 Tax=Colletotrichum asianum TaxID=702518 RepID=A0A8H3ZLH3_9PEZI|nr:phosphatidylserine decarboxylase [Colletotrichum asianum]
MAIHSKEKAIHHHHRPLGFWPPGHRKRVLQWVASKAEEVKRADDVPLDPTLVAFQQVVNDTPFLKERANKMFTESSKHFDPTDRPAITNFNHFVHVVNSIITTGPPFYDKDETAMGLLGFPINAVLDWPMGTLSGVEFWLHSAANSSFKSVLNTWGSWLKSNKSQSGLKDWLSPDALGLLANAALGKDFSSIFECDPSQPYYGFDSWDDFFTREFKEGQRPVFSPDFRPFADGDPDPSLFITNACESAPLQVAYNVQLFDNFWLKGQPYSLVNMLNNNSKASQFVGGTVYQAFLSAKSYHRWHAPVSGKVVNIEQVPGTYYAENYFEGLAGDPKDPDPAAPNYSQPYISAVATRGIIYIEAENSKIGLMAIVFIGMAEVSSCEFTVSPGDTIQKGQQIGMFHFGGSSHCMVFRPGVELTFEPPPKDWNMDTEKNNKVNSLLAKIH